MSARGGGWRAGRGLGGLTLAALLWVGAACGRPPAPAPARPSPPRASPPRPAPCQDIPAGAALQPLLDAAPEGAALCLAAGVYQGPIRINRPLVLWGPPEAMVRTSGVATTVRVEGDRAALLGFTIDGSGARYEMLDAAVHVQGEGVRVEGLRIQNAVFGILVDRSTRVVVRGNHVEGDASELIGMRGDAIRLWETSDSRVEGNRVLNGRDVVVWYSPRNVVAGNEVVGGRYGTHFMYSHDCTVESNRYERDVVGVFVMYSRGVTLRDNLVLEAKGAAGMGIGLKDSGNITLEGNRIVRATTGLYIDHSPVNLGDHDLVAGNLLRFCDSAVTFHSGEHRNTFRDNAFADNGVQVQVEGGGNALDVAWEGNYFDDYAGYDLDGDSAGDVPYEVRSFTGELTSRRPDIAFFDGSPAMALANAASRLLPLLEPQVLLRDPRPRMTPPRFAEARRAD